MAKKLVDAMCYDLACYFMQDKKWTGEDKTELAETIQQVCEDAVREEEGEE